MDSGKRRQILPHGTRRIKQNDYKGITTTPSQAGGLVPGGKRGIKMFTIGELKERFKGQYDSIEVYYMNGRTFHTDSIRLAAEDEYTDITECVDFELMDKERYFRTIEANTSLMPDNVEDEQFPILVIGIK
jgi:hypothetical protein